MNVFPIEPAPDPEDAKRQLPPVNTDLLPGFPLSADPTANIGAQVAASKALQIAATRYKASNAKVIKSSVMSYREALQQLSMLLEEDDPLVNTPVVVVELAGTFQRRRQRPGQTVATSSMTRTKGYIVLRAADGLLLGTVFTK